MILLLLFSNGNKKKPKGKKMNTYERIRELIVEVSKEDLEHYKGRPSRKKVKAKKRFEAGQRIFKKQDAKAEADEETRKFRRGGRGK